MICPECKGERVLVGFVDYSDRPGDLRRIPCLRCDGRGYVPDHEREWIEMGRAFRRHRREKQVTLRRATELLGISAVELSTMERGQADPSGLMARLDTALKKTSGKGEK